MPNFKGFTILETICVMALFLFVILTTGTMFMIAQTTYRKAAGQGELIQNARVCLDRLSRELRQSAFLVTDVSSSSTPADEIFFQNGHDNDTITYIRYYLDGTDLRREHSAYYFLTDPATYVYYYSTNAFGVSPEKSVLEDRVIGEYFDRMEFYGENGMIDAELSLSKENNPLIIGTKIYIRNW